MAMHVSLRKPEQLAAFYTGRGFDKTAIQEITKTCFVGIFIENKTYEALWLILEDWNFISADGSPLSRYRRSDWKKTWQRIGLKQAHQSTFSWTQLPERRDLRTDEHVGGNIALPWQPGPFTLIARFKTRLDQSGTPRKLIFENLKCQTD